MLKKLSVLSLLLLQFGCSGDKSSEEEKSSSEEEQSSPDSPVGG